MNKEEQMRELIKTLNEASDAYYGGKEETMSNFEWDQLFDELVQLETETGTVFPDSPTAKVGAEDNVEGTKEPHEYPALSLNKSKDISVIQKWAGDKEICLSWKLDGMTLVLTYDNGNLSKVVTRGNGLVGTNITYLADVISGIPMKIPCKDHIVVRGEATIRTPDFEEINASLPENTEPYSNPRNLVAGTLALDKERKADVKERKVQFTAFTLVRGPEALELPVSHGLQKWSSRMCWLTNQGFTCVDHAWSFEPEQLPEEIEIWTENVKNGYMLTPVDGLVLVFEDTEYAKTFTTTGHHDNGAGMAYKWPDTTKETTLDHVEWSCGATCITPVAVFDPVQLEGTTVQRASLHNISEAKRIGIGAGKETTLEVFKANLIIPQVASADAHGTNLDIPDTCPVCGGKTEIYIREAGAPEILRCTNPNCAAKALKKFARFVSKDGLDIDGLSEKRLADLIAGNYLYSPEGLLQLAADAEEDPEKVVNDYGEKLTERDGWGVSSVANLLTAIKKAVSDVEFTHLLYSMSIPMCGHDVSKKLVSTWDTSDLLAKIANIGYEYDRKSFLDELKAIEGIGEKKAEAFVSWFYDKENYSLFFAVLGMVHIKETKKQEGKTCNGLTFVITGSVHIFKNRTEFKEYVETHGGKVAGSVSKKTDFLVSNEPSDSSKSVKAAALGVPVITEDEFIATYKNN